MSSLGRHVELVSVCEPCLYSYWPHFPLRVNEAATPTFFRSLLGSPSSALRFSLTPSLLPSPVTALSFSPTWNTNSQTMLTVWALFHSLEEGNYIIFLYAFSVVSKHTANTLKTWSIRSAGNGKCTIQCPWIYYTANKIQCTLHSTIWSTVYRNLDGGTIEIKLRETDYENKNWFELLIIKGFSIRRTVLEC